MLENIPAPPAHTREMFDPVALRKNVLDTAKVEFEKKLSTIESNHFKLKVSDVHYPDPGKKFSIQEQKEAIMEKRDLTVPLRGKIEMFDKKDGSLVDSKETILARVPWITERQSVILNGSEYLPINQTTLKAGSYSRKTKAGTLESFLNIEVGSGLGGRIIFNPQSQQFHLKVGGANFHLYSLLKDTGKSDKDLENAWGKDLLERNRSEYDHTVIDKLHAKVFREKN